MTTTMSVMRMLIKDGRTEPRTEEEEEDEDLKVGPGQSFN